MGFPFLSCAIAMSIGESFKLCNSQQMKTKSSKKCAMRLIWRKKEFKLRSRLDFFLQHSQIIMLSGLGLDEQVMPRD